MRYLASLGVATALAILGIAADVPTAQGGPFRYSVTLPPTQSSAVDGRLLVIVSRVEGTEPRFQVTDGPTGQPVFGIDVENGRDRSR